LVPKEEGGIGKEVRNKACVYKNIIGLAAPAQVQMF